MSTRKPARPCRGASPLKPFALNLFLLGLLAAPRLQAGTLSVGPNRNTTRSTANNAETTIAVNPLNPANLFVSETWSLATRYSTDGGVTWQSSNVSALPTSDGDVSAAWDSFGNLFLVRFSSASTLRVVVGLSTNGGASFSLLYSSKCQSSSLFTLRGWGCLPCGGRWKQRIEPAGV